MSGDLLAPPPLVEAVPNFSEGRDSRTIDAIAQALDGDGANLLDVDSNAAAHRTVYTVAGPLPAVERALLRGLAVGTTRIDMRNHRGAHPRIGAADVVPLVLLCSGAGGAPTEADESACLASARRVGDALAEWGVPVFLYERSAIRPEFRALPRCRRGGYEQLGRRFNRGLLDGSDGPDLGPRRWSDAVARSGASVVGVRPLLLAMNLWLECDDVRVAERIAAEIRSSGGGPWSLPQLRAIGWALDGDPRVQVSCNLLAPRITTPRIVLEAVRARSPVAVHNIEPIGLIPAGSLWAEGLDEALLRDDIGEPKVAAAIDHALSDMGFQRSGGALPPDGKVLERRLAAAGLWSAAARGSWAASGR